MEINIIRGQNQIGGSIIEVSSKNTKIILDVGSNLDDKEIVVPEIEGLFKGEAKYDGVLISHYHSDHEGLATKILPEIPIYMGEKSYEIHKVTREYIKKEYLKEPKTFKADEEFLIGDIKITPYLCDHSAFDAYMFLLDCEGKKILYTGDFRSNGRKSFEPLLRKLPKVDVLITEGTNLSNNKIGKINLTEKELEKKGIELLEGNDKPVFVLMAATNIDRIVTFYKIANATKRLFLIDTYAGVITDIFYDYFLAKNWNLYSEIPLEKYAEKGRHLGHGGMDYVMDSRLVYCLQHGLPLDMDVYDMAEWCALAELGALSMNNNCAAVTFPDFTRGHWNDVKGYTHAYATPDQEAAQETYAAAYTAAQKEATVKLNLWTLYDAAKNAKGKKKIAAEKKYKRAIQELNTQIENILKKKKF